MTGLYVYALATGAPAALRIRGWDGAPLRTVEVHGIRAVVGAPGPFTSPHPDLLRAHDAVVRKLASRAEAVLPVRFGTVVEDEGVLVRHLQRERKAFARALELIAGRVQFAVRLRAERGGAATSPLAAPRTSGAAYLRARAEAAKLAGEAPEFAQVRRAARRFVRAERIERHREGAPFVVSVFHLVEREEAAAYRRAVRRALAQDDSLRALITGPAPAYAFAPEVPS